MVTGGGHSHLEECLSVLGVPVMSKSTFINTEHDIGEWWKEKLMESMIDAGKEEKRLAEVRGSYHDGVPAITDIVDGGWCKRSHKHSYNMRVTIWHVSFSSHLHEYRVLYIIIKTVRASNVCTSSTLIHS